MKSQSTSGVRMQESVWLWMPPSEPPCQMMVKKWRMAFVERISLSVIDVRFSRVNFLD